MSKIDLDGNGTLEFDEFLALIKTAQTMKKEKKPTKRAKSKDRETSLPPLKSQ